MIRFIKPLALLSLLLAAALFGFFYAWVCSTMWGLDAADPRVAIEAMQAMNASVRNAVFAPAFFGTSIALLVTTMVLFKDDQHPSAYWFTAATLLVALLGVALTMAVNVPMNEALALVAVPEDIDAAQAIWDDYSPKWQLWNQVRTVATGVAVLCIGIGMLNLRPLG
ncbi:putative integral membrane protein [Sulfitobacter noctilucicola]|uniref:Putative membrane protein n=1 Tax=Sulfitobacter noctilucicola TaxID=1342301 RepID=A0A7W6Q1P3_9RHOB|nr:anthrone oxygenase family protein [Sulfitobacter noctilucicola]KIN63223.1 putative integral membrane protein [Sulfitobacter noctilucicola]MBB4172250.1 putative membrane protein [Sulfitobacter noctilucicola]